MQHHKAIEARAAALYDSSLPYHNFQHAQETVAAGAEIVAHCHEDNVPIDDEVVYYALLFHDAGYHEDHQGKGYDTKEEYAAALAAKVLAEFNLSTVVIDKVMAAIRATHRDAMFTTTEEKAVRAADLAGLAADYGIFRANSEKLKAEWEMLHGREIGWREWICQTAEIIQLFLSQDIRLTHYYADASGESIFHKRTRANMRQLYTEKVGATDLPPNLL
jgi:HD superfamily phosphodiesterase